MRIADKNQIVKSGSLLTLIKITFCITFTYIKITFCIIFAFPDGLEDLNPSKKSLASKHIATSLIK